jgi:hypothetical protein
VGSSQVRARLLEATEHRVAVSVEGPRGSGTLELSSAEPVWATATPTLDFAAVALVQHAAADGCDLVIDGPATRAQLDRLDEYQMIWSSWRPDLFRRITLHAQEEVGESLPAGRDGAVMGFSGGVDAAFALAANKSGALGRTTQDVRHAVMVVDRSLRQGGDAALQRATTTARRSLHTYGVELAVVWSNWQENFSPAWFMSFNAGYMAVLHTFAAMRSAAVHATDRSYLEELRIPPYGSHMAINHLLGHPGFPVVSAGGTHTRLERVAFLVDHPVLLEGLRVCYQPDAGGGNCGHCEKCVRTQLELRAVGADAGPAFPSPLTLEDIGSLTIHRRQVLMHFEAILERLSPEDTAHEPLRTWMASQRSKPAAPRIRRLRTHVERLEQELRAAREEIEALRSSAPWGVTGRLRPAGDRVRGRLG